jgi:hypothetical protein
MVHHFHPYYFLKPTKVILHITQVFTEANLK